MKKINLVLAGAVLSSGILSANYYSNPNQGQYQGQGQQGYYQGQAYYQGQQPMQGQPMQGYQGQAYYQGQPMQGQPMQGDVSYSMQDPNMDQSYRNQGYMQDGMQMQRAGGQQNIADADLQKKIQDELKDYKNVRFQVRGARVIVFGTVDKEGDRKDILKDLAAIEGLNGIENRVMVGPQFSNRDLDQKIRDKIKNYKGVVVQFRNGTVILTGTVDKDSDRKSLMKDVASVDGVNSIENQTVVKQENRDNRNNNQ